MLLVKSMKQRQKYENSFSSYEDYFQIHPLNCDTCTCTIEAWLTNGLLIIII